MFGTVEIPVWVKEARRAPASSIRRPAYRRADRRRSLSGRKEERKEEEKEKKQAWVPARAQKRHAEHWQPQFSAGGLHMAAGI